MPHTTTAVRSAATLLLLAGLSALQGCSREIDARQTHVEQGLIYKKDASDPFTGKLTSVGIVQVGRSYATQYGDWYGGCTVPVHDGLFDGIAECKNPEGKKVGEFTYSKGQQAGVQKVWASDNGNLMLSISVRDGVPDGVEERYNPKTGKIIGSVNYQAGKKVGSEKLWDITGETLLTDLVWENGSKTGVYRFDEREEHYKAGAPDGVWKRCQLNREIPMERLKPNYEKFQLYAAMADKLGGTYFLPALVDSPSGVVCTEEVYMNGVKQVKAVENPAPNPTSTGNACLDSKIADFYKTHGSEQIMSHDERQEWEAFCKDKKW